MRIAYLINQYPKVSHSFIRREILALERQGFDILRISIRGWSDALVDPEDLQERKRTRYVLRSGAVSLIWSILRIFLKTPVRFIRALHQVWRMGLRADRPLPIHLIYFAEACQLAIWLRTDRVLHLHAHFGTNSAEVALLAHILTKIPWSFTVHGPEEFDKTDSIRLAEKIRRCCFVVGISSFGISQLYRLVDRVHWRKVRLIRCGLEDVSKGLINFPPAARRLVCVGRLCEQKGQLLLIEAVRYLANEPNFELVLVGDGEMRQHIETLIANYGLQSKIRITGWLTNEQVLDQMLAARALVLPSFAEGLPIVIMEAMAMRRPVISTFVGGIPELVVPGEHGWLVPAGDVSALTNAIRACLHASPEVLTRMGNEARERVIGLHNIDANAAELATLFLGERPSGLTGEERLGYVEKFNPTGR